MDTIKEMLAFFNKADGCLDGLKITVLIVALVTVLLLVI